MRPAPAAGRRLTGRAPGSNRKPGSDYVAGALRRRLDLRATERERVACVTTSLISRRAHHREPPRVCGRRAAATVTLAYRRDDATAGAVVMAGPVEQIKTTDTKPSTAWWTGDRRQHSSKKRM